MSFGLITDLFQQKDLYKKLNLTLNRSDMFTGIVQDLGEIVETQVIPEGIRLWISSTMDPKHFTLGNSIAVNGVCLTVESFKDSKFQATAVHETLRLTTLGDIKLGTQVNLEAPLTLETPIAGHLVSGHVDGVANVIQNGPEMIIELPEKLKPYIAMKGSVTVNGVSLTIAALESDHFKLALIPETLERTNLDVAKRVNLEVDLIARYLEQLNKSK